MRLMLHFGRAYPWRTLTMLLALLLAGWMEGFSLTALLPLLNIVLTGSGGTAAPSGIGKTVMTALQYIGIAPTVVSLLTVVVAGVLLKSVFILLADRNVGYTVAHIATDLRLALLRAVLGARWEYYLSQPIGSLANSAATEVMRASQAYLNGSMVITYFLQSLVYAAVALLVSWQASIIAFSASCVLLILMGRLVQKAKQAGRRETELLRSLLARLTDSLQSLKPLKAMGREHLAEALLEADTIRLNKALRKQVYSKAVLKSLQDPVLMLLIVIGLYTTLVLWHFALSMVMVLVYLLARLIRELQKMQRELQDMARNESAFWSLQQKIEAARQAREEYPGRKCVTLKRSLRFVAVSFSYGDVPVLKSASLEVPAGLFVAVIGPSGAGKTTLVDLVTGLLKPQEGKVLIDDVPMEEIDVQHWRRQIGYVPQDTVLLHDSILANITLGDNELTAVDVEEALRAAEAWDFVTAMPDGLQTIVGERGAKLSGGQRQRIAIARALAHRPVLLILDEATSALDPENEKAICRTLWGLRGRMTMLAISHQSALVELADRIYGIREGRVYAEGAAPVASRVPC